MPIYEYVCGKCGEEFEKKQGFNDESLAMCPICQGDSKRVIRCVPVIFKGSGFYVTDYKKDSTAANGSPAKKDAGPDASTEPKKETSTPAAAPSSAESKPQSSVPKA